MALTGLHTNWQNSDEEYAGDILDFIKKKENFDLYNGILTDLNPYYDGSIAIGYGFDLLKNDNQTINNFLTYANDQTTALTSTEEGLLVSARTQVAAGTATEGSN